MRRNYASFLVLVAAMATGLPAARSQIAVQGVDQTVIVDSLRSLVVAQFFDLKADPAARFAERVGRDLFDRPLTEDEIRIERDRLRSAITPDAFVREKLHELEHLDVVVDAYFLRILGRLPDATERIHYADFLFQGHRESDLIVELFTAPSYLSPLIELDPQGWLDDIFTRIAARAPTAAESAGLMTLYSMNYDDAATVQVITNSDPVRARLTIEVYRKLMLRDPTTEELARHLAEFALGMNEDDLRVQLLLSLEYGDRDEPPVYSASVDWGDGSQSEAVILSNYEGGFIVAEHAYAARGAFTLTTLVANQFGVTGSAISGLQVINGPKSGTDEIFSIFAGYIDGPAASGLLPGETTGDAEGAYSEDADAAAVEGSVVAGATDASGNDTNATTALLPCGYGAPLALLAAPLLSVIRVRRSGRASDTH